MSDSTFQWGFIGVTVLAIVLIVLAAIPAIPVPSWVIAIAIVGGIGGDVALLWFWGRSYMERY